MPLWQRLVFLAFLAGFAWKLTRNGPITVGIVVTVGVLMFFASDRPGG